MKILITGSAGFVGSHATEWLLEKTNWDIVGIDSFRHQGDSLRVTQNPRYKMLCHDLNAPISDRMSRFIGDVDYVINVASMSHVDTSINDPVNFWESNTRLIGNILEYSRRSRVKAFIQCSTDEVFGAAPDNYFHHEWDVILPSNPYAASKAAQEALTIAYWRTYNLPVIITNTMNMIYTKQDPEKFVPMLIKKIYKGQTVSIHGTPDKIGSRMYLDCRNLADAWLFLLRNHTPAIYNDGDHVRPSRYNIAGLEEIDNLELAKRIAKLMGKELKYEFIDFHKTRPGHDRRYALDNKKMLATGWVHPVKFDDTLKDIIEFTLKNQEWMI